MNLKRDGMMMVMVTVSLSVAGGLAFAANGGPTTPELAAKKEMVRSQQEQRVTGQKRKAAAEALKAERLKIYRAKKAARKSDPGNFDTK